MERAESLPVKDKKPQPLLMGRHLLSLGLQPGSELGKLIRESFELQLEGELTSLEDALVWARQRMANNTG